MEQKAEASAPERILLDSGTSYSKVYHLGSGEREIIPTRKLRARLGEYRVEAATGHNASRFSRRSINELVALAQGGRRLIDEDDFLLLDCGSRDIKYVHLKDGRLKNMNWNTECGAFSGTTVEMILKNFDLTLDEVSHQSKGIAVTCGVLGMTALFDLIANDVPPGDAVGMFIKGIADNCYNFAGRPGKLYLSGGFCENPIFLKSFDCEVIPLGRFVLIEGLREEVEEGDA